MGELVGDLKEWQDHCGRMERVSAFEKLDALYSVRPPLERLAIMSVVVFGGLDEAAAWLNTPHEALDGMTPARAALAGETDKAIGTLAAIFYGLPA